MQPAKLKGVLTGRKNPSVLANGQNSIMNGNTEIEDHLNCEYTDAGTDSGLFTDYNH